MLVARVLRNWKGNGALRRILRWSWAPNRRLDAMDLGFEKTARISHLIHKFFRIETSRSYAEGYPLFGQDRQAPDDLGPHDRARLLRRHTAHGASRSPWLAWSSKSPGPSALDFRLVAEAIFLGSPVMRMTGKRGVLSGPTGREPLVGLRLGPQQAGAAGRPPATGVHHGRLLQ